MPIRGAVTAREPGELDLVARAGRRDEAAIRAIMLRYNRRLYRLARSVLRHDADAEDAVQQAYVKAFAGIAGFRGEAALGTWLSRIVINVALDNLRRRQPAAAPAEAGEGGFPGAEVLNFPNTGSPIDPERSLAQREIGGLLERAIDDLPTEFRTVLMARVVEDMSIHETAELFGIRPETVKTRLHRARRMVRKTLEEKLGPAVTGVFPFAGRRCERLADTVIARLRELP